ncbi:MAG: ComF family protein [Spirochaetota bacterium]
MTAVRTVFSDLSEIFFPAHCALCGKAVSLSVNGVCSCCRNTLDRHSYPLCVRCGAVMSSGGECPDCSDRHLYYDQNISLFGYSGTAERLVHQFKFNGRRELGSFLGSDAAAVLRGEGISPDAVTWVPARRSRKKMRGYNQSEVFARAVASYMGISAVPLLLTSPKGDQKKMPFNGRFLNIIGRFSPIPDRLCPGKVLLVDDVFTTGATVNECARILKKMGASHVFSLTIARVNNKKVAVERMTV